ncbi:unnamed protein product [Musa banksii]
MRKIRAQAALVTCLILVVAGICSHGFAGEVEGKRRHATEAEKRLENESAVGVATVALHRCRSKKTELCGYLVRAKQKVDDDKRAVPTGPNPLHNR